MSPAPISPEHVAHVVVVEMAPRTDPKNIGLWNSSGGLKDINTEPS